MNALMQTHLSRLTLKRESPDVRPLIATLLPRNESEAMSVQHRMLWSLFSAGEPDAGPERGDRSHFLWRQADANGRFYLLGPRPRGESPYFRVETRPFDVAFRPGQKLAFELRVNATVNRLVDTARGRQGRKRCDVVMDALLRAEGKRADIREAIAHDALEAWMTRQAQANGFSLNGFGLLSYRTVRLPKPEREKGRGVQIGITDIHGRLTVEDPVAFGNRVAVGFGRFKAFGCGLMLVRPVGAAGNDHE